ncbi:uncharacterized protein LOC144167661 isoform X3 [Haemaphysalis longicornis]
MARRDNEEQGKIFVGGLSWETTQDGLLIYFSRYGEVVDSVVMCNETGRSRGFGFVTFRDPSCVATVLAGGPHQLDGRTVDPKSCIPRSADRAGGGGGGGGGSFGGRGGGSKSSTTKIFVGGLPATVTETDLHAFFSKYGKVTETRIMYDREWRSRGFGFVTFDSEDPVNQLTSQRYVDISGKQVECKRAEPSRLPKVGGGQQQQQWGWGSSNGGGNSGYQENLPPLPPTPSQWQRTPLGTHVHRQLLPGSARLQNVAASRQLESTILGPHAEADDAAPVENASFTSLPLTPLVERLCQRVEPTLRDDISNKLDSFKMTHSHLNTTTISAPEPTLTEEHQSLVDLLDTTLQRRKRKTMDCTPSRGPTRTKPRELVYTESAENTQREHNQNVLKILNTAPEIHLQCLARVGPKVARMLYLHRLLRGKFDTFEDLRKVEGLGKNFFDSFMSANIVTL